MLDPEWIEHRRGRDGERLGWIVPEGDDFVAVDLLGRRHTDPIDWVGAEEVLDAGHRLPRRPLTLRLADGRWLRVCITEVTSKVITVSEDHGGAVGARQVDYKLQLPVTADLRPLNP
ncbi:hypothetical protein [Aeromicrobium sp. UC242_57]|uniref:hypothetical protein n=1 Tax=Aeromicrobium sp. UC242_57 TaxID=3374624 RepID=UPI003791A659